MCTLSLQFWYYLQQNIQSSYSSVVHFSAHCKFSNTMLLLATKRLIDITSWQLALFVSLVFISTFILTVLLSCALVVFFFMTNCTLGCQCVFLTGIQPAWSCFSLISYSLQLCHSKVCCVFPPSFHTIRSVRENICLFGLPKLIFLTNYKWQFFGKISEQMNKIKCYRKKVD